MAVADMIPGLDDKALANLRENAARLSLTGSEAQKKQAATLTPLIEAELASRLAAKAKPARGGKRKAAVTATAAPSPLSS